MAGNQAFADMWLKAPGLAGPRDEHKLTLTLKLVNQAWLVAAITDVPFVPALDQKEASR